jgi:SNW domain-containing protein 1
MASLLSRLPAPVHSGGGEEAPAAAPAAAGALARVGGPPPPAYGGRQGWVPRKPSDFADGGAYPECHVAQYPLECGRKGASAGAGGAKSGTVAVTVKEDGSVDYSALVKQGSNAKKVVATAHSALVPKLHDVTEEVRPAARAAAARNAALLGFSHARWRQDLARPEQEVVDATLAATKAVIEARVNGTLAANQPKSLPAQPGAPQYIKYTPAKQGPEYNSGASHRIIKMHTVAVDPMQPPKFAHKKARAPLTLAARCAKRLLRCTCRYAACNARQRCEVSPHARRRCLAGRGRRRCL